MSKRKIKILNLDELPKQQLSKKKHVVITVHKSLHPYQHIQPKKPTLNFHREQNIIYATPQKSAWYYRYRNVRVIDKDNICMDFPSTSEASLYLKTSYSAVHKAIKKKTLLKNSNIFYLD